jgi:hypothetical protein
MQQRYLFLFLSLIVVTFQLSALAQGTANETEAKVGDWSDFKLPAEAVAAGIDGKLQIGLSVSAEGKASKIRIFGGPMWPCSVKDEPDAAEDVRKAVKLYLANAKFQPATKNGKPRSSDVQITFRLSQLFQDAANSRIIEENLEKGIYPALVDVADIDRFALNAPKQLSRVGDSISYRISDVQILVDENGRVVSAGGFRMDPRFQSEARSLACASTFKPLTFRQKAMRMTGIIRFGLY